MFVCLFISIFDVKDLCMGYAKWVDTFRECFCQSKLNMSTLKFLFNNPVCLCNDINDYRHFVLESLVEQPVIFLEISSCW